jgi:hypothetical protein
MGGLMLDTVQAYYDVREYTDEAKGIAYDGCHKIYVLMDDEQLELMKEYGYGADNPNFLVSSSQLDPAEMATVAMSWFKDSCGLRFIQGVITDEDPNKGFFDIIAQFEGNEGNWDEDEDDDDL